MAKIKSGEAAVAGACALLGAAGGGVAFWMHSSSSSIVWIVVGGLIGGAVGFLWRVYGSVTVRNRMEEWRLEEVEIQGFKFTSAGAQRRTAWRLFIDIATRIAIQPMHDENGDDGVALKSLYDLFQSTRNAITEMRPTPNATGDTIETYALDMLNRDLRPFLSKWHPRWEAFAKTAVIDSPAWSEHAEFRKELRDLQRKIATRAKGLALIAGVRNVDRFFEPPDC